MQSADDVQFGDAQRQRLARFLNDFIDGQLKTVLVAFLARERAELAGEDAVVRVVDVTVDDIAGARTVPALVHKVGDGADGIEVFALEEPQSIGFGNPFARDNFVIDVAQLATFEKKFHRKNTNHGNATSAITATKNTALISALRRKNATLIHFKLRRREIGRASCRERVEVTEGAVSVKKKKE